MNEGPPNPVSFYLSVIADIDLLTSIQEDFSSPEVEEELAVAHADLDRVANHPMVKAAGDLAIHEGHRVPEDFRSF